MSNRRADSDRRRRSQSKKKKKLTPAQMKIAKLAPPLTRLLEQILKSSGKTEKDNG